MPMSHFKRVACLTSLSGKNEGAKSSEHLMDVFNFIRKHKKENNVNGVILVKESDVLILLEGEQTTLADIVYRIGRKSFINAASTVLNMTDDTRLFENWRIKFVDAKKDTVYLTAIYQKIAEFIKTSTSQEASTINKIFDINDSQKQIHSEVTNNNFQNKTFKITSWPKPSQFKMTTETMNLCALLLRKKCTYDTLRKLALFSDDASLNQTLSNLLDNNLLTIEKIIIPKKVNSRANVVKIAFHSNLSEQNERFGTMLKKFIKTVGRR